MANFFDQFDQQKPEGNFFDQFDPPEAKPQDRSYLGASLESGVRTAAAAGARLIEDINPFTTSDADLAVLFKDKPEELKKFQERSFVSVLSRFANEQTRRAEEVMQQVKPGETGMVSGKPLSELEYATLDPEQAAYLSPSRVAGDVLQSLPSSLMLAVTAYLTRGRSLAAAEAAEAEAIAAGASAEAAKAAARNAAVKAGAETMAKMGAISEGAIGYGVQKNQSIDEVMNMKQADLEKAPAYKELIQQGYSPEAARVLLANQVGTDAGVTAGAVDAATNLVGGRVLGGIIGEGGKLGSRIAKGFFTEGGTELVQSMGEQAGANLAARRVDPNRPLDQNVLESGAAGFMVGGVTGGTVSGLIGSRQRNESLTQIAGAQTVDQAIAGAGQLAGDLDSIVRQELQPAADALLGVANNARTQVDQAIVNAQRTANEGLLPAQAEVQRQLDDAYGLKIDERAPTDLNVVGAPALSEPAGRATLPELQRNLDRRSELLSQSANAGFEADRLSALEQERTAAEQLPEGRGRSVYADLTPMDPLQVRQRLAVMREENPGVNLAATAHPSVEGKFAIRTLENPTAEPNIKPAAPMSGAEQNKLEGAAMVGMAENRRAEDGPRQRMISRAMANIEARGGVASPMEAEILREANLGQPFNRIDPNLGRQASTDEKLTAATGIAVGSEAGLGFGARESSRAEPPAAPFEYNRDLQGQKREEQELPILDRAQAFVNVMRRENTPAARAFVREFDAGRITMDDVAALMAERESDPTGGALEQAAGKAPKLDGVQTETATTPMSRSAELEAAMDLYGNRPYTAEDLAGGSQRMQTAAAEGERVAGVAEAQSVEGRLAAAAEAGRLAQPTQGSIILTDAKFSTQREPAVGSTDTVNDGGQQHRLTFVEGGSVAGMNRLLRQLARVFGKRVAFFNSDTLKADGFVRNGDNRTIYINASSQMNPLAVFGHELMHLLKRDNPVAYRAVAAVIARRMDAESRAKFRADYGSGANLEELSSDLLGNAFNDEQFLSDVFTEIGQLAPEGKARGIVMRFAAAINKAIKAALAVIKSGAYQQLGFKADDIVKNLEEIRAALKGALKTYAQEQLVTARQLEAEQMRAEASVALGEQAGQSQGTIAANDVSNANKGSDDVIQRSESRGPASGSQAAGRDEQIAAGVGRNQNASVPSYGEARKGAVQIRAVHYSKAARETLAGSFYGTGLKGAEAARIERANDGRLRQRVYFYVDEGRGVTPESGVGGIAHDVTLNNIYDPASGLIPRQPDANSFESAVIDAGFDGYMANLGNGVKAAVLLGPKHTAVPVAVRQREAQFSPTRKGTAEEIGGYTVRTQKDGTLAVLGDAAEIRGLLPEGVTGRPVPGGIVFTTADAPRVRAALEGRKVAYSRGGAVLEKLPMKNGKYVGAPAKFDTPAKIPTLRKSLRQLADEGAPGRYWYENSSREVLRMVGGNVQEARKFVALLAIYSPQAKVDANSTFALRAWAQYKAGQQISVKTGVMDRKAQAAMDDVDAFWSGEKTGNFFFNLLREIDPSTAGKQGATIDMWMMRAGQYDTDAPTATQYAFMENETNRLAQELGWEPQQVQAAIWVAMKARMENAGVKRRTEETSEKKGWIRFDYPMKNGRPVKTRVILNAKAHRDNWLKHAFAHDPTKDDTQQAKFDFSDGVRRHIGQLSWEARPGRSTGVLPGVNDAAYEQQVEFQQAVQKALLDDNGVDLLAYKLGLLIDGPDILAPGVWQGEVSAGMQKLVAMAPAKGDAGKTSLDPAQKQALDLYAAVLGLLTHQEGVGYHRPFYNSKMSEANGVNVDVGRPLQPDEAQSLWGAIDARMREAGAEDWESKAGLISAPTGMRIVNMGALKDNGKFRALVKEAAETLTVDEVKVGAFASDGDLITNNWKESPNGEDYRSRIAAAGSPDLLEWARDVLAPRVQSVFNEFSSRYGWGNPGEIKLSPARDRDGRGRDQGRSAAPLAGAPTVAGATGPDVRLVGVAEQYARENGIPLTRQAEYAAVDEDRARRIADAYDAMEHAPQDPRVKEAYQNLIRQTVAQYRALEKAGYKFWLFDDNSDPYEGNPWNAMRDLRANQSMGVYATEAGFGSGASNLNVEDNPLLADTGIRWPYGSPTGPRRRVLANDLFRAVHDAFGHGLEGSGFRAQGEENAWQAHVRLFTGSAVGAITSETRGQNSWLNYGPYGEANRNAAVQDTVFADQKTGLMPEWTWTEGRVGDEIKRSAQRQTDTPEFKNWFGDSVLVNDSGDPLVVYHGTSGEIKGGFDLNNPNRMDTGWLGTGVYLTDSDFIAEEYAYKKAGRGYEGANVLPLYARLENPYYATNEDKKRLKNGGREAADQFARELQDQGYDGVILQLLPDAREIVVFDPAAVKSATGNSGAFSREDADITKSKQRIVGDSKRQYTPEQKAMFQNVGRTVDVPTFKERLKELRKDMGKKLAQGIVDQFAPIKELDGKAYALARLSKGASGAFEALLHHGKLAIKDGVYDADQSGGFIERLGVPLRGELEDFLWWVAANRAERLAAEDRERLFTPADIAAGKSLDNGTTDFDYILQHGPNKGGKTRDRTLIFRDALKTLDEFNRNTMDMAEQSGLIDGNSRPFWENEFYVPFYRVSDEDGGFIGAKMSNALVRQRAFKQLKGGTDKINSDLLANMLQNWAHLIDAAAKNRAAMASLQAAEKMGVAVTADEATVRAMGKSIGKKNSVVWYMDGGVERYYLVDDPYVMTAITSLEFAGLRGPLMDAMSRFKHWLTVGVTSSPVFKVRNLIRDSIQAIGTSDLSYNPVANIREGIKASSRESQTYVSALASGGLIRFGTMLEGKQSDRVRQLIKSGVKDSTILDSESKVKAFYDKFLEPAVVAYNELGNRGEEINRAALFAQLQKQGVDQATAALLARDLMDFSMQGAWTSVRFLTQVVPFMNARLQGMYKLGRAAKEDPKKFGTVLGATALFSIALMLAYQDDDDWKKREDWDRDNFWWFKIGGVALRIPKPFEIGALGTLAERGVEYFASPEMTGERFMQRFKELLLNNLSMNPVPQLVKPIVDIYANKDSFSGRPIETMGMERKEPEYRYTANTSMVARGLSTGTLGMLSPVQYDHLIRGYFGWLGSFVVSGADTLIRPLTDEPTRPEADYYKLATGGILAELPSPQSRYVSQMYKEAKELEQAYGTWKNLLKEGRREEAAAYREENLDKLKRYKQVEKVKQAEAKFNERIRMIERSKLDPAEKKDRIAKIRDQQDRMARRVAPGYGAD